MGKPQRLKMGMRSLLFQPLLGDKMESYLKIRKNIIEVGNA
jgi:hypothetical protein